MGNGRLLTWARTWFPRLSLAVAGLYLAAQFFSSFHLSIRHEWGALRFPYPLDYGEGQILDQVNHLARFQPIYFTSPATHAPPYTIANYPPLFQLVQVPFAWIFGTAFWYGRLIALLGMLAAATFVALIVHTLTASRLAGVVGALTMLCMPQVIGWTPYVRVDNMALGLSMAALFVVVRWPQGRRGLLAAAGLMVAAAYTKHSYALSVPLASFVWLSSQGQSKRAFQLVAIVAGAGLVVLGVLMVLTRGSFFFNIVTATKTTFGWESVGQTLNALCRRLPLMMLGSALLVPLGLLRGLPSRTWVLVAACTVGAMIQVVLIGKDGASISYLFELSAAFGMTAGVWVARLGQNSPAATAVGVALLATQIGAMDRWTRAETVADNFYKYEHSHEVARLHQIVRDSDGPVLADEYMGLLPLENRTVYMQPFEFEQLRKAGLWDDSALVDDVRRKLFPAILVYHPANWDNFQARWSPRLRDEIQQAYEITASYARTDVYTPRR